MDTKCNGAPRCLPLSPAAATVIARLNAAGYEAYAVGGCVRDALMGRVPEDWDITTAALPEQVEQVFGKDAVVPTGLAHGTVTVLFEGQALEVTTYRIDGAYSDSRHPDSVHFTRSLTEDLRRRDFTINSMAYHPVYGLTDPFSGEAAILERRITCVGDPHRRFAEDALRILRALRFSAVLGFTIDAATAAAARQLAPAVRRISAERITGELCKLLCGKHCGAVLRDYGDILQPFLPLPEPQTASAAITTLPQELPLRLAAVLALSGHTDADAWLHARRIDHHTATATQELLQGLSTPLPANTAECKRLLGTLGLPAAQSLLLLYAAIYPQQAVRAGGIRRELSALAEAGACCTLQQLAIDGNDLLHIGCPAGRPVGLLLRRLLGAVITENCPNTPPALLTLAQQWLADDKEKGFQQV